VTGVEALTGFSGKFLTPHDPSSSRDTVEDLEMKITTLKQQLEYAETDLDRLRKGKQKA